MMTYRPCCIVCCSDCDTDGIFTSCQHFICPRCAGRYPPGQCPRCRKPCKAVKAGPALPKEVADRVSHNPQHLLQLAAQALDFQRRQEQQSLQRLRELVTTLNQSNRSMASQISAAKAEREELLTTIKQLQRQLYTQQQQQSQQQLQLHTSQRTSDVPAISNDGRSCGVTTYNGGVAAAVKRSTPVHASGTPGFTNGAPAARGWLSSPAPSNGAADAFTPLGWGQSKRSREEGPQTPTNTEQTRFRLATPAITLRNVLTGSRETTPRNRMDCVGTMAPPRPLQSLLCRGP